MIEHLNIESLSQDSFDDGNRSTFKTSPEVIQKVMNVPMCAVMSILRSNGYSDIHDETSLCIDEERLGIFTEAYVRKMKNYFTRSLQNISSLPPKERSDYNKFVKLFKKEGVKEPKKWENDIDINYLKEVFVESVKEETEKRYCSGAEMRFHISPEALFKHLYVAYERAIDSFSERILEGKIVDDESPINRLVHLYNFFLKHITDSSSLNHTLQVILHRNVFSSDTVSKGHNTLMSFIQKGDECKEILRSIINSGFYLTKPVNEKPVWCGTNLISRFVSFARYYIYSVSDDEDSHSINIEFMKNKNLMFDTY